MLITGCTGFLGRKLTKILLEKGYSVIGCGRTVPNDITHKNFNFIECDLTSFSKVENVFKLTDNIDIVIHLAAYIDFNKNLNVFQKLFSTNVIGTWNLLNSMLMYDIKKLIFSSSMAVIGIPKYLPIDENHPTNPNSFYGLTKLICERLIFYFSQTFGIKSLIFRFPGLFSENRKSGAIYTFIRSAYENKDIVLYLKEPSIWDILYLDDAVTTILKGINKIDDIDKNCEIFNIDYGEPIDVEIIAKKIVKKVKSRSKILKVGNERMFQFYFDNKKVKKLLEVELPSLDDRLNHVIRKILEEDGDD